MSAKRRGGLVDLRCGPHEVVSVMRGRRAHPLRASGSRERAYGDVGNFVTGTEGEEIQGKRGEPWPEEEGTRKLWAPES